MPEGTVLRCCMGSQFLLIFICMVTMISGRPAEEKYSPRCPLAKDLIPLPFPHPQDCSSFFLCSNGTSLELQCKEDLLFDAGERECRDKKVVSCKTDARQPQPAFAVCPPVNGQDVVMFPHPVECSMYYVCDHGIPHPRKCPESLHYNRLLRTCDYPHSANCVLVFVKKQ